ncbi:MAG: AsmA family protein [Thermoanaerobaculia bacterium]
MSFPRLLRRFVLAVAFVVGVVAIVIFGLLVFQPTLELTRVKELFEEQLTAFVEAPVTVESVWLKPALWPTVGIRGLVIESSDTQSSTGFARLESAEIQLGLLPLLTGEIRVRKFLGSGVELRARRNRDRTGNWPVWTTVTYDIKELKGLELRDISAEYEDRISGDRKSTHLDLLEAEIGETDPLQLEMEGRLGETRYSLSASGPTLDDLFQGETRWPLDLALEIGEAHLELGGEIDPRPGGLGFDLLVAAEVSELDRMAARIDLKVPAVGPLELRSRVTALDQVVTFSEIEARLGDSDISGSLAIDHSQEVLRLTGQLTAGLVDLYPWLGETETGVSSSPASPSSDDTNDSSFAAESIEACSADVELRIDRVAAPGPEIRDLSSRLQLDQGLLVVPLELVLAGNGVRGRLEAEREDELHLRIDLDAQGTRVGELARQLAAVQGADGTVGSLRLRAESRGTTPDQLVERLAFDLRASDANLTYGVQTESDPLAVAVDHLALTQQAGSSMRLTADGSLLDERLTLSLTTENLAEILNDATVPLALELRAAGAAALIEGTIDVASESAGLDLGFQISGDRAGDLSGLLGVSAEADLPYRVEGRLSSDGDGTRVRLDESSLGRSALTGELAWVENEGTPLFVAELEASVVDPTGLALLVDPVIEVDTAKGELEIASPLLPSGIYFDDAEIHLEIDRLLRRPVDVTDLEASIRFRDGKLEQSPFSLTLGDTSFRGALGLDLREEPPEARLRLTAEDVDLGNLLAQEELVTDVELTVERLDIDYLARGSTASELFSHSELHATLRRAHWFVTEPATEKTFEVLIDRAEITGPELQPIELEAAGTIGETPFEVAGTLGLLTTNEEEMTKMPVSLTASAAGARLDLTTDIDLPFDRHRLTVDLQLAGERLDTLSPLVGIDLPPVGPYRLSTDVEIRENSYALPNLDVSIDDSDLQGMISLTFGEERPRLTAELMSSRLDLDDLFGKKALVDTASERDAAQPPGSTDRASDEPREPLLTAELLRSADAFVRVSLGTVESQGQHRGGGELTARLEDGQLEIAPFLVELPEGSVDLRIDVTAIGDLLEIALQTRIERLDYGLLLKRVDPESEVEGALSLDSHLRALAPSLEELLVYADGHLDFTLYPENFRTTLFDLWATHLLAALIPTLDSESGSQLNCVVGRFTVESGVMTPEALLIDTSRIRVRGKGKIDLQTGKLNLTLKPRPKTRGLISLATPAKVTGRLDDPSIRLTTAGLARTFFRLSVWFWTAYLELFRRPLPADGADVCIDPSPRAGLQTYSTID